ncbi:non-ribosomal peptide synthetase [Bradyrhizobium sp. Ai1a-2]|uniref:non-ribosomal peptide synthetase n=1 Tax=Bradyrhizobium sp. Ai1a-2 TaxID=196490 RepID=UPI00048160E7|nr:non-ribosomal peptide synthetase [Bradyrhizobium sp. Ai1a-2]
MSDTAATPSQGSAGSSTGGQALSCIHAFSCIGEILDFYSRDAPDRPAVLAPGRGAVTYAELATRTSDTVRQLRGFGIAQGDRVALVLPRGVDNALALIAVATAAVCIPVNPDLTGDELQRYFSELELAALVTSAETGPASRAAAHALGVAVIDLSPRAGQGLGAFELAGSSVGPAIVGGAARGEDDAFILLTSGTASRPKMVPLTHASVCLSAYNAAVVFGLGPQDRLLNMLPLFHAHALISGLLTALAAGSSVICTAGFDPVSFFTCLKDLKPTWYTAVPTIHRALLSASEHDTEMTRGSSLRMIRSASASLPPAILQGLEARFGVPVIEIYGMTEGASQIAANPRHRRKPGSVGLPAGPEIAIMDNEGRRLPAGERGEIVLRGPTICRGYYNDPEATRSAFRDGWFRTGDLGYLDADGYLFIVGRIKDVINRGGQKISPLEVEEALLSHPDVREAGVFGIPHQKLGETVGAAIVLRPRSGATAHQLRQFARQRLAAYKVPSLIRMVQALPKGASGKLQRSALVELVSAGPASEDSEHKRLPRSELERQLAEIWARLLEVEQVGVDQDVFALGADSLAVTQMLSRLREQFGTDLSFKDIFDAPTVAELAGRLQSRAAGRDVALPHWRKTVAESGRATLSFQQQRMYVLTRLDRTKYNYNVVEVARLSGRLDLAAFEASIAVLCERHEVLRSTFSEWLGEPVQRVEAAGPRVEHVDLKGYAKGERQAAIRRETLKLAHYQFDLEHEPPLKARLLHFSATDHALLINIHHLVTDGWSQRLFWQELQAHYAASRERRAAALSPLAFQYRDFAAWQQDWAATPAAKEQLSYWRRQLDGVTTLPLRTDRPRPQIWSGRGARHYIELPQGLSAPLRSLSQAKGVTPFMTLLAAFQCLLHRYTGHEDVAIGSLIANRNQIQTERLIGLFANTVIMRTDCAGDPTFGELLRRVRQVTLDAYRNQDLPIEEVLRALQVSRSRDGNPLFPVMFILQSASIEAATFPGLSTQRLEIDPQISRFDITLELVETDGRFSGFFEYSTDLFDASTIAGMAMHFDRLLKAIIADPGERISRFPLLSPVERRQALADCGGGETDFSAFDLCERFDQQVARAPEAIAVSAGEVRLSYRELADRSAAIATRLAHEGIGDETVVALFAERSPDLLAAILAVQRVGAAFLCLDPAQPAARLAEILASSGAALLLVGASCSSSLQDVLSRSPIPLRMPIIHLEGLGSAAAHPAKPARRPPSSLAYVIYTSGSSGTPKGVMIEQRGLSNHLASLISELGLSSADVIAQTAPQSFVISVWQFLAGPVAGACVHICADEIVRDPELLAQEIERAGVTVLQIVPSLLRAILEQADEAPAMRVFSRLRLLISTGEPLAVDLCRAWFGRFPEVPLVDAYGASECSDDVALHRLTKPPALATSVPIGRPLPNARLYVLDPHLQLVPAGIVGELCVGGAGVGRGYINDPGQTNARFLRDPFSQDADARLYRTGDLARRRADGTIECLGRIDDQVKIRGYRIELKEIEHVLLDHPDIRAAIVEPRGEAGGETRLVAHIVAAPDSRPDAGALRDFLKGRLPGYMVPAAFLFLERIPLNSHGKVDRVALRGAYHSEPKSAGVTAPARRGTEKALTDIWIELLKVPSIGVADNFFDLGGHSLLAGQVMARVARAFGVSLPIKTIFEAPTVEELARRIDDALATKPQHILPVIADVADIGPRLPSIAQVQMLGVERELSGLPLFNLPFALRLQGPLDLAALKKSLGEVMRRHESLRTAFGWDGDEPAVVITPPGKRAAPLTVEDLTARGPSSDKRASQLQLRKAKLRAEQEARTSFDLTRAPLWRAHLLRLGPDDHALLLTIHHAIADGWSIGILFDEISQRYAALVDRRSAPALEPALPFSDAARRQRGWCGTDTAARQAGYWKENLRGVAPVFRNAADVAPAPPSDHQPVRLSGDLVAALTAFASRESGTLFMALLTGLKTLLAMKTSRDDICVATAMANRSRPETERVIGPFENTAIIRTRIDPGLSFRQAFARVRDSVLEAHARQELPFSILAARLAEAGIDPASLIQVYFTLQNPLRQPLKLPDVKIRALGSAYREGQPVLPVNQTWLSLMLKERPTGITGSCSYKRELFGHHVIPQWMEDLVVILTRAAAQPNAPLQRLLRRRAA